MAISILGALFSIVVGIGIWAFLETVEKEKRFQNRVTIMMAKKKDCDKVSKIKHISHKKFYIETLFFTGVPLLLAILWQELAPESGPIILKLIAAVLIAIVSKFLCKISNVQKYRRKIEEALPGTLDLLVVCLEAGMSLHAGLARLAEETKGTPLSDELRYTFYEMNMGITPEDAFRNLATRTNVSDVKIFVTTIIESEKLGMQLGDTLRNHSTLLRETIRIRTREKVLKLPIKLLFPLVFLIMPSIFVVLLAPSLLRLIPMFEKMAR